MLQFLYNIFMTKTVNTDGFEEYKKIELSYKLW